MPITNLKKKNRDTGKKKYVRKETSLKQMSTHKTCQLLRIISLIQISCND